MTYSSKNRFDGAVYIPADGTCLFPAGLIKNPATNFHCKGKYAVFSFLKRLCDHDILAAPSTDVWGVMLNPGEILSSSEYLELIDRACRRSLRYEHDRDECWHFVMDKLREDNCRRLRAYKGNATFSTFLYSVLNHLIQDFIISRTGKWRVPVAIKKLGSLAEAVYRLICRDRYTRRDAYEIAVVDWLFRGTYDQFVSDLQQVWLVPCRQNPVVVPIDESPGEAQCDTSGNPLELLLNRIEADKKHTAAEIIRTTTADFLPQERVLLRLVYAEDCSVAAAARVLGLGEQAARNQLEQLLSKLRDALLKAGIGD